MGIKKIARPINKAKNEFIKWLEKNNATDIDVFEGESSPSGEWDYYRNVCAFIGENFYMVYFMMMHNEVKIEYVDEENRYEKMSINEFLELLK